MKNHSTDPGFLNQVPALGSWGFKGIFWRVNPKPKALGAGGGGGRVRF